MEPVLAVGYTRKPKHTPIAMKTLTSTLRALLPLLFIFVFAMKASGQEGFEIGKPLPNEIGATFPYEDGFVNLRVVDNNFRVYFLDEEKNLIEPTWPTASIRWFNTKFKPEQANFAGLRKGSGPFLYSDRNIVLPIYYWINLSFVNADGSIKHAFPRTLVTQLPETK